MRGLSLVPILMFAGIAAGSPAFCQAIPPELAPMMREGCYSLTGQQAAASVAQMEAGLPGLIERRRMSAGRVLELLADVRRLDRLRLDEALIAGLDSLTGRHTAVSSSDALTAETTWLAARDRMQEEVRQLRSLDLGVRLIEAWLPQWRACRDQLLREATQSAATTSGSAAPPVAPVGTLAAAVGGRGTVLRFSEYARFGTSSGGREYFSGDGIYILLRFGGDGRLSGSFEGRQGANSVPVAGTISGNWSRSEISGRWETQPGRIARFRILTPRFEAGPNSELVVRGRGIWCAPSEIANERDITTGDYARFYGMIWGPVSDPRPELLPEADRLCPNRGGPN